MQPDMLQSSRIHEPDFELKVGYAVILLEFRIQQSPQTHLYFANLVSFNSIGSISECRRC